MGPRAERVARRLARSVCQETQRPSPCSITRRLIEFIYLEIWGVTHCRRPRGNGRRGRRAAAPSDNRCSQEPFRRRPSGIATLSTKVTPAIKARVLSNWRQQGRALACAVVPR